MVFDLERYIDEPIVYFDDTKKIDDQKLFLLGVRIRSDMVDLLLNGVKAEDITVKKLKQDEDPSHAVINMVASSVLADWGFELTDASEIDDEPDVRNIRIHRRQACCDLLRIDESQIIDNGFADI